MGVRRLAAFALALVLFWLSVQLLVVFCGLDPIPAAVDVLAGLVCMNMADWMSRRPDK